MLIDSLAISDLLSHTHKHLQTIESSTFTSTCTLSKEWRRAEDSREIREATHTQACAHHCLSPQYTPPSPFFFFLKWTIKSPPIKIKNLHRCRNKQDKVKTTNKPCTVIWVKQTNKRSFYLDQCAAGVSGAVAGTEEPVARLALTAGLAVGLPALVERVAFARLEWNLVPPSVVVVAAVWGDFFPCRSIEHGANAHSSALNPAARLKGVIGGQARTWCEGASYA